MPSIVSLTEYPAPIDPTTPCGAVLDRFLDSPGCDLLVVVDAGKPRGVVTRGAAKPGDVKRPAADVMTAAVTVDAQTSIDDACALLLAHREPLTGLVVVQRGRYRGVVTTRELLRHRSADVSDGAEIRRFLELVSHEVRSPMNGVLAVAELLQRQPLSADSQAFVRTIIDSSHATLRVLNAALELSSGAEDLVFELAPCALRDLMDELQSNWQVRAAQDGVTLLVAYDGAPDVSALLDAGRIRQIFDTLIDAALTLNRKGAVEASLQAVRTSDGLHLVGRVRDTGGGLSAARLAKAFADPSATADQGPAGSGLGLILARRIIDRMEGAIRVENNVGAGATIVFEIAAQEVMDQTAPGFAQVSVAGRCAHVLVVDDNATNRMVAEALCEMFDCTSESVEDGLEAVEAARTGRFDLILMDIRMPRMDGVEATRAIRALPGAIGSVPIIALTANADPEDAKTYIATGMHSVVEKPIKPERLLQAINAALPASVADGQAVAA
jgi:CheY-like chemotaxis protein/signal transduction histidine kinase